jgi:hypothetical protein
MAKRKEAPMAFDYKTWQTMAASQPPETNGYCPECGRPWVERAPEHPRSASLFPWRSVILTVLGVALALTFGFRAASAYRREADIQRDFAFRSRCVSASSSALACSFFDDEVGRLRASYRDWDAARGQRDRALAAAALGLVALAVGAEDLVRRRHPTTPPRHPLATVAVVWRIGKALLTLACFQVLALYLDLIALHLSQGGLLTQATLDRAADDALSVISIITGA